MLLTEWKRWSARACLFLLALTAGVSARAEDAPPAKEYAFEMRLYQVLTSITGNGLISQTLPATLRFGSTDVRLDKVDTNTGEFTWAGKDVKPGELNAWLQIVHERLDNVELAMEGATLTWNGQSEPEHPRILAIAKPNVKTPEGKIASIKVGPGTEASLQYMVKKEGNLFELRTWERGKDTPDPGVTISLTPRRAQSAPNLLDVDFSFDYAWVGAREGVEGVDLPIGKPRVMHVKGIGSPIQMRLGEWSCYTTHAESQGWFYLFIRATDPAAKAEAAAGSTK